MVDLPFSKNSRMRIYAAEDDPLNNPDIEPLLVVDAVVNEGFTLASPLTEHPVEDDTNIGDHSQIVPGVLNVTGIVTDTPLKILQGLRDVFGPAPAAAALDTFKEIRQERILLTIVAGDAQVYENYFMTVFTRTRTNQTGQALAFAAVFQELRIVSTATVPIPLDTDAISAAGIEDAGQDSAKGVGEAQLPNRSFIKTLINQVKGAP